MAHSGYCGNLGWEAKKLAIDDADEKRDTLLTVEFVPW